MYLSNPSYLSFILEFMQKDCNKLHTIICLDNQFWFDWNVCFRCGFLSVTWRQQTLLSSPQHEQLIPWWQLHFCDVQAWMATELWPLSEVTENHHIQNKHLKGNSFFIFFNVEPVVPPHQYFCLVPWKSKK
jgi:hypothetical protein